MAKADYINMWHLPPLADPGPRKLAIQLAFLSSFNCLSNLPATSRLRAASLAWGDITPIREIRHWACALTMQVLSNLLYWLTITLSCPSSSGLPVERQMCSTLLSALSTYLYEGDITDIRYQEDLSILLRIPAQMNYGV